MPLIPNLTPELKREILRLKGLSPEQGYDVLDTGQIVHNPNPQPSVDVNSASNVVTTGNNDVLARKPPGGLESFGRAAAQGFAPAMVGLGATAAVAAAPLTGGASLLLPLGAGLAGAMGTAYAQDKLVPESVKQQLFTRPEDAAENPVATFFGGLAPNAIAFNPARSLKDIPTLLSGAKKLPTFTRSASPGTIPLTAAERAVLTNAGFNAAVSTGQELYEGIANDDFSLGRLAANAIVPSLIFTRPTTIGRKVFGFQDIPPNQLFSRTVAPVQGEPLPVAESSEYVIPTEVTQSGYIPGGVLIRDGQTIPLASVKKQYKPGDIIRYKDPNTGKTVEYIIDEDYQRVPQYRSEDPYGPTDPRSADDTIVGTPTPRKQAAGSAEVIEQEYRALQQRIAAWERERAARVLERYRAAEEQARVERQAQAEQELTAPLTEAEIVEQEYAKGIRRSEASALPPEESPVGPRFGNRPVSEYPPEIQAAFKRLEDLEAQVRGITLQREVPGPGVGQYDPATRTTSLRPNYAGDTAGHETIGHGYILDMLASRSKKDRDFTWRGIREFSEVSTPKTIEEFAALPDAERARIEEGIAKALGNDSHNRKKLELYGTKLDRFLDWWADTRSALKYRMGIANSSDVLRSLGAGGKYAAPYGTSPEFMPKTAAELAAEAGGPTVGAAASTIPREAETADAARMAPVSALSEQGKQLEKQGMTFDRTEEKPFGTIKLKTPEGQTVSRISYHDESPDAKYVEGTETAEGYKERGYSGTLYRELANVMQQEGQTKMRGDLIAPQPLHLRNKTFGEPEELLLNRRTPISSEEALKKLQNPLSADMVYATHRVDPKARYSQESALEPAETTRTKEELQKAFGEVGSEQRGTAESLGTGGEEAKKFGGAYRLLQGSLNYNLEHVGDLIHRLSSHSGPKEYWPIVYSGGGEAYGRDAALSKTKDALRHLETYVKPNGGLEAYTKTVAQNNDKWFKKEGKKYAPDGLKETFDENWQDIKGLLTAYADEHAKLKPASELQKIANDATIALGRLDTKTYESKLKELKTKLESDNWLEHYYTDVNKQTGSSRRLSEESALGPADDYQSRMENFKADFDEKLRKRQEEVSRIFEDSDIKVGDMMYSPSGNVFEVIGPATPDRKTGEPRVFVKSTGTEAGEYETPLKVKDLSYDPPSNLDKDQARYSTGSALANANKVIQTPEFKDWFSESKVVDDSGKPTILYHGTTSDFTDVNKNYFDPTALYGPGFYMTESREVAGGHNSYAFKGAFSRDSQVSDQRSLYGTKDKLIDTRYNHDLTYEQNVAAVKKELLEKGHSQNDIDKYSFPLSHDKNHIDVFTERYGNPQVKLLYANIKKPFYIDKPVEQDTLDNLHAAAKRLEKKHTEANHRYLSGEYKDIAQIINEYDIYSDNMRDFYRYNIRENDIQALFTDVLKEAGYDGITHIGGVKRAIQHRVWIAFEPTQVKSAIGNNGKFDPTNPDIRYSTGSALTPSTDVIPERTGRRSFMPLLTSRFDKVAERHPNETGRYVSDAFHKWQAEADLLEGRIGNKAIALTKDYTPEEIQRVDRLRHALTIGEPAPYTLTANERRLKDAMDAHYRDVGRMHQDSGMLVRAADGSFRRMVLNEQGYRPSLLSNEVAYTWAENIQPKAREYDQMFIDHAMRRGETEESARNLLQDYKQAIGHAGATPDVKFGALRKVEGMGLPWELVDQNYTSMASRYGRRAAADLSFFKNVQNDPKMLAALPIRDQQGKLFRDLPQEVKDRAAGIEYIGGSEEVKQALRSVYGIDLPANPRLMSAARAVGSMVMQTGTGIRNLLQIPPNVAPYYGVDIITGLKALAKMNERTARAFENNAIRSSFKDFDAAGDFSGNPIRFIRYADKISEFLRKYTGRELSDKIEGLYHYSLGEELATKWFAQAKNRDIKARQMIKRFGSTLEKPVADYFNPATEVTADDIARVAKSFVDAARGTYSASGLPGVAIEGNVAPFLALSRWSIERSNIFWRDVVEPMKGGDFMPLLKTTFATLLTGAAIEQLNEALTGKRGVDPTIKEALADGDADTLTAKAIGLAQLGSYAGIVSDAAKVGTQLAQGKSIRYTNPLSMPMASAGVDIANRTAQVAKAIREGEDPFDALALYAKDLALATSQNARYAYGNLTEGGREEAMRKEKFRDLRVFEELTGRREGSSFTETNPYLGLGARNFKRSDDIAEAFQMVPDLVQRAVDQSQDDNGQLDIEVLRRKLRALKLNNYQTVPDALKNPRAFTEFMDFLSQTQGPEAATERATDFYRQRAINKMKSSAIPSF